MAKKILKRCQSCHTLEYIFEKDGETHTKLLPKGTYNLSKLEDEGFTIDSSKIISVECYNKLPKSEQADESVPYSALGVTYDSCEQGNAL